MAFFTTSGPLGTFNDSICVRTHSKLLQQSRRNTCVQFGRVFIDRRTSVCLAAFNFPHFRSVVARQFAYLSTAKYSIIEVTVHLSGRGQPFGNRATHVSVGKRYRM